MLKMSMFTNFAYLGIFIKKKNRKKPQIYCILRYSLLFTCPFYDMVSYICNPKSPLPNSLLQETQNKRMSTFKKIIKMD